MNFYSNTDDTIGDDDTPFALTLFEASPLNGVIKQSPPGSAWQPIENETELVEDRAIKKIYEYNSGSDHVYHFRYDSFNEKVMIDNDR